jgi:hypothetical protein
LYQYQFQKIYSRKSFKSGTLDRKYQENKVS